MIRIDSLRLHLPSGFEHRAATIARQVSEVLARKSVSRDVSLESISIPPQRIHANTADEEIAQLIANQIIENVEGGRR